MWTIGHSTRTFEEFVSLLRTHEIEVLADVRLIPRSRRHPHFNDASLAEHLPEQGVAYHSFLDLGGRRKPRADSINTGWRNESFRGYADYMQSEEFGAALARLEALAQTSRTAIMCAEAVPWRCHRSLIADALTARDWSVLDILGPQTAKPHQLTSFARVADGIITYPGEDHLFTDPAARPRVK